MARSLTITCLPERADALLQELRSLDGLLDLQVYRGASIEPPGDVLRATVRNATLNAAMRILDTYQLGQPGGVSLSASQPDGFVPTHSHHLLERDTAEGAWEEMALTISEDSNTSSPNTLLVMALSGGLATVGLSTNALHLVVAGMLIAPGFMPITRLALCVAAGSRGWRYGLADLAKGYLALMLGAAATALVLRFAGQRALAETSSYYVQTDWLFHYWSTFTFPSILASAFAAIAGAALVATKRSVFTSGVMIGLALVPTAALVANALTAGNLPLAVSAGARFATEVVLVFILSLSLLLWSRFRFHRRDTALSPR